MIKIVIEFDEGKLYSEYYDNNMVKQEEVWAVVTKLEQMKLELLNKDFEEEFSYVEGDEDGD